MYNLKWGKPLYIMDYLHFYDLMKKTYTFLYKKALLILYCQKYFVTGAYSNALAAILCFTILFLNKLPAIAPRGGQFHYVTTTTIDQHKRTSGEPID